MRNSLAFLAAIGLSACGPNFNDIADSEGNGEGSGEVVTVSVGVSESDQPFFGLAAATAFSMSLDGCASGLTYATISDTNPNIDVYKFDQGCLVKLNSFDYGGVTYVPSAGDPFTSWIAGDLATFEESGNPANTIRVAVATQLDNPVSGTEAISYTFSEIVAGADEAIAKTVVSDAHAITVAGQAAPNFTISAVRFVGMTATGGGQFQFTLDCAGAFTGTVAGLDAACDGTLLSALTYNMVEDTYASVLTAADASTIFGGGSTAVAAAQMNDPGGAAPSGGFVTLTLTGPDLMHTKPNMILILEAAGTSYQYFNIDVTTLTYTP